MFNIYQQKKGLAIGLSLSLTNIYMEYSEEIALGMAPLKPPVWMRYEDYTFILWPYQEAVQILLDCVNSVRLLINSQWKKKMIIN